MTLLITILIFIAGEAAAIPLFRWIHRCFRSGEAATSRPSAAAVAKGVLERAFLYIGLITNIQVVIVAFAALKLGTRLKDDQANRISNDYFLIGNLTSLLLVILYYVLAISVPTFLRS